MSHGIGTTTSIDEWKFNEKYVERIMDNAAYTSAHPDDTLVLAGPPRRSQAGAGDGGGLYPIGMMQAFQATQQKPVQPLQTIGSSRNFFVMGKASTQFTMGRLFVKGKNLLRALNNNIIKNGLDLNSLTEPTRTNTSDNYLVNLDSEMFLVPFGLAVLFRDKSNNGLGGFYMELCVINSFTVGMNAGQSMIMENVSGLCDRIVPFDHSKEGLSTTWDSQAGFVDSSGNG